MVLFSREPVSGPITGHFAQTEGYGYPHRGVDYGVPVGTPVYAPAAGTVVEATNDGSFGIAVCLDHHDGWYTLYAHLSQKIVVIGEEVHAEDIIGVSGSTGMSTGPHLHWQLCRTPTFPRDIHYSADPLSYMEEEEPPMTPAETEEMAALRARRQLAALCADLNKYTEMLDLYQYAMSKGYLA